MEPLGWARREVDADADADAGVGVRAAPDADAAAHGRVGEARLLDHQDDRYFGDLRRVTLDDDVALVLQLARDRVAEQAELERIRLVAGARADRDRPRAEQLRLVSDEARD